MIPAEYKFGEVMFCPCVCVFKHHIQVLQTFLIGDTGIKEQQPHMHLSYDTFEHSDARLPCMSYIIAA